MNFQLIFVIFSLGTLISGMISQSVFVDPDDLRSNFTVSQWAKQIEGLSVGRYCGSFKKYNDNTNRIAGGTLTKPGEYPSYVHFTTIYGHEGGIGLCGGTLISKNLVITAAHCFDDDRPIQYSFASIGHVVYGPKADKRKFQTRSVSRTCISGKFNREVVDFDIAIVRLNKPVEINEFVKPACLMLDQRVKSTDGVYVVGMGQTPSQKQPGDMSFVAMSTCDNRYLPYHLNSPTHSCLDSKKLRIKGNPCLGDSGGPVLVSRQTTHGQRQFVVGAVSFGIGEDIEYCFADPTRALFYTDFHKIKNEVLTLIQACS